MARQSASESKPALPRLPVIWTGSWECHLINVGVEPVALRPQRQDSVSLWV